MKIEEIRGRFVELIRMQEMKFGSYFNKDNWEFHITRDVADTISFNANFLHLTVEYVWTNDYDYEICGIKTLVEDVVDGYTRECISLRRKDTRYETFFTGGREYGRHWLTDRIDAQRYAIETMNQFNMLAKEKTRLPEIEKVIFNNPSTIVMWKDGTKTIVKCQEGDTYSDEVGLSMCIAKKALGNQGNFNDIFKKWIPNK